MDIFSVLFDSRFVAARHARILQKFFPNALVVPTKSFSKFVKLHHWVQVCRTLAEAKLIVYSNDYLESNYAVGYFKSKLQDKDAIINAFMNVRMSRHNARFKKFYNTHAITLFDEEARNMLRPGDLPRFFYYGTYRKNRVPILSELAAQGAAIFCTTNEIKYRIPSAIAKPHPFVGKVGLYVCDVDMYSVVKHKHPPVCRAYEHAVCNVPFAFFRYPRPDLLDPAPPDELFVNNLSEINTKTIQAFNVYSEQIIKQAQKDFELITTLPRPSELKEEAKRDLLRLADLLEEAIDKYTQKERKRLAKFLSNNFVNRITFTIKELERELPKRGALFYFKHNPGLFTANDISTKEL